MQFIYISRVIEEKLHFFESENHRLSNKLKRTREDDKSDKSNESQLIDVSEIIFQDSPEIKKQKTSLGEGAINTPSPMSAVSSSSENVTILPFENI